MKRLVLETEFARVWLHVDTRIVHHEFRKYIWGEHFRGALNSGLQVMTDNGSIKWLSDDRENSALSREDSEWSVLDWQPRAVAAGWKYWAIVQPESVLGQMNIERLAKNCANSGITVRAFSTVDRALSWLEQIA